MSLITNSVPVGAITMEINELDFAMEMGLDAIDYHDEECCTGTNPCDTRVMVLDNIKKASARRNEILNGAAPVPTPEVVEEASRPQGNGNSSGRQIANVASDAQIRFIRNLLEQKSRDGLKANHLRTITAIESDQVVGKAAASSLITALKDQPAAQGIIAQGPAASPAQIALIERMAQEQDRTVPASLTKSQASDLITEMMANRDRDHRTGKPATAPVQPKVTEGMYRTPEGEIYKVQVAVHGSGKLYAKRLMELDEPREMKKGVRTHDFEYVAGGLQKLTSEMKMTREEAQAWGRLYGTCCRCGMTLTDEQSIAAGIGPICGDKF